MKELLKQLSRKITKLTYVIYALLRLKHTPTSWKVAKVITITKPGKPPHIISFCRHIFLLPAICKLFEKLRLERVCRKKRIDSFVINLSLDIIIQLLIRFIEPSV